MIRGIALEGGGARGAAYPGCYKALEDIVGLDWDADLEVVSGTSAGAIMAAITPACHPADRIEEIVQGIPWGIFREGEWGYLRDLWHLWKTGGWYRNHSIVPWLESLIEFTYESGRNTTLDRVYELTGCKLYIDAVDEVGEGLVRFGPDTHPGMRVVDAVMASISIPIWFPPYQVAGGWYSDGGLLSNHPVDALEQAGLAPEEVIGFRLDGRPRRQKHQFPKRPIQRAINLIKILVNHSNKSHVPDEYWPRIVRIDTGTFRSTDFDLTDAQQKALWYCGYEATKRWLDEQG